MKIKIKSPMRESQRRIFYKNMNVIELRNKGEVWGYYGRKFPKTAQDIIDEVEKCQK